jgi:hypothetical protein
MRIAKRRPLAEYRIFGQALLSIPIVRLALICLPLRLVRRGVWKALGGQTADRLSLDRVVRCVTAAARISPVPSTCLASALIAEALLHGNGYRTRVRVGVRREADKFAAHAWLERQGSVIVGGPPTVIEQYTPFPSIEHLII